MAAAARRAALSKVFERFDLDGSGHVELWELQLLGQSRRRVTEAACQSFLSINHCVPLQLGQKGGIWSPELNKRCIDKIDSDRNGLISKQEFTKHFDKVSCYYPIKPLRHN